MSKLFNALDDIYKIQEKYSARNKKTALILIPILVLFFGGIVYWLGGNSRNQKRIEEYIENGDYVNARKTLVSLKDGDIAGKEEQERMYEQYFQKISRAQIASLIDNGDFSTAQDIALEDNNYEYYLDSFLGKLISLYNRFGVDKVYEGLALIKMSNDVSVYNDRASIINNAIEGLAIMLVDRNQGDAKLLCSLLKPTKDSNGKMNNKEVEAIKKRIGIK